MASLGTGRVATEEADDAKERKLSDVADGYQLSSLATAKPVPVGRRVITSDEIGHFKDLGLGRGVDATDPKPWINKRSFCVRHVSIDNVIGTEEGDLFQGFVSEIESTQNLQANLSAAVPVNHLVNIGIDGELSRSYSKSQKSVGLKIVTRTASFQACFDDILKGCSRVDCDGGGGDMEAKKTFEVRLTEWICQQVRDEEIMSQQQPDKKAATEQTKTAECTMSYIGNLKRCKELIDEIDPKKLSILCCKFIYTHSITHYVYAIHLGAFYYRVMSQEEFSVKVSSKAAIGVTQVADAAISGEGRFGRKKNNSKLLKVGHITGQKGGSLDSDAKEMVNRGTSDEAVVGVKLQPISSLIVHQPKLRKALQDAIQKFINCKQNIHYGPFYISCINSKCEQLFLKVGEDLKVQVTSDINKAEKFHVVRSDEEDDHFQIIYKAQILTKEADTKESFDQAVGAKPPIAMHLHASINWFSGRNDGNEPLKMHMYSKGTTLALRNRVSKQCYPAKLTEWVNEQEAFFINCQERSFRRPRNSYLCVYRSCGRGSAGYVTGCRPHVVYDDPNTFMLFRLNKPVDVDAKTMETKRKMQLDTVSPSEGGMPMESQAYGSQDRVQHTSVLDVNVDVH